MRSRTVYAHEWYTNKHCRKAPLPPFPASFPPFPSLPAKECRMKYWWNAHSLGHVSIHSCQTHPISMCLDVYVSMRATVQMRTREGERERGGHKLDYGTIACSGSVSSLATVAFDLFFPKAFAFALWFLKSFQVTRLAVTAAPSQAQLHQFEAEVAGRLRNFTNVSRSRQAWTAAAPAFESFDSPNICFIGSFEENTWKYVSNESCSQKTMIPPEGIGWAAWERNLWAGQSCSFDTENWSALQCYHCVLLKWRITLIGIIEETNECTGRVHSEICRRKRRKRQTKDRAASIHSESRLKKIHKTVVTMEGKLFILIITWTLQGCQIKGVQTLRALGMHFWQFWLWIWLRNIANHR